MANFIMDCLSNQIRDELPSIVHDYLPEISPVYKYIVESSIGVQRDTEIGDNWMVNHLYGGSVAGLVAPTNPMGPARYVNSTSGKEYLYSKMLDYGNATGFAPFPTASQSPHAATVKRTLQLHQSVGNFNVPITWMQADTLSATQVKQIGMDIQAVGKLRALVEAQSFFMAANNTLGQITGASGTTCVGFKLVAGTGRVQFFRRGMMIDVWADYTSAPDWAGTGDGQLNSAVRLIVADIDYVNKTIYVVDPAAGANISAVVTNGSWVTMEASGGYREMKTFGLNDWIADSGTIMGAHPTNEAAVYGSTGLDLDLYREFKSMIANVAGPLTEDVMNRYFGGYFEAYPGNSIDTILTTTGVTLKYLQQPGLSPGTFVYDRTNAGLTYNSGWNEVTYMYNGKRMNWMTSPMCLSGTLYGLNLSKGNIKRYVPPRIGGTDGRIGSEVEFLAPLAGLKGIFMVGRTSAGAAMQILEAPFWQYMLIAPVDVRAIKLTGLTEVDMTPPA